MPRHGCTQLWEQVPHWDYSWADAERQLRITRWGNGERAFYTEGTVWTSSQSLSHWALVLTEMESVRWVEATIKAKENLKREEKSNGWKPLFPCKVLKTQIPWEFYSWAGTSLEVQWLRLCTSNAGGEGLIPSQGTRFPQATWCGQKHTKNPQNHGKPGPGQRGV